MAAQVGAQVLTKGPIRKQEDHFLSGIGGR